MRRSVRPCINQDLADALAPLRTYRFLKYGSAFGFSFLSLANFNLFVPSAGHEKSISYATCISVIIGTPFKIETVEQAKRLPKVPLVRLNRQTFKPS